MADPDNPDVPRSPLNVDGGPLVSNEAPWPGLASFSEETRAFFHGRDAEIEELSRRVQRKLLTVLFGQSGLGKTSLLQAGLGPRLRAAGYCPVYVRIDYGPDAPTPVHQIQRAFAAALPGGPAMDSDEGSWWEFMHRRERVWRDAEGRAVTPLLMLDQFEEVFTVGQGDERRRQRAQAFVAELADVVENRPPAALERRIERDEVDPEAFDFARADYRLLIALREDYLAPLEALRREMPSITQNRQRLARMNGAQALEAVMGPGAALVSEEVARQIVLFVSGARRFEGVEVEPALLSLVCRELNNVRLAQGRAVISAELLEGSRATILADFYERACADQPAGVRHVIEDTLLTDSGFRENVAEERIRKALLASGAAPDALETLVGRRLLRIEERLDVRRVELTHDVLCGVVKASRDARHEREAKAAAEAQIAATRAREAAQRQALRRARLVAIGCAALAVIALGGALIGYFQLQRTRAAQAAARTAEASARQAAEKSRAAQTKAQASAAVAGKAEADAEQTRRVADEARNRAEKLMSFLLDDFYDELAPTGRVETIGKLAQQTVAYYDGLPADLRTPETVRNRALALWRYASALRAQGRSSGSQTMSEALAELEKAYAKGDRSEATVIGLVIVLANLPQRNPAELKERLERATELIQPLAIAANATPRHKHLFADLLFRRATAYMSERKDWLPMLEQARKILAGVGALDYSNLSAATLYAQATSRAGGLYPAPKSQQYWREVIAVVENVLQRRPGDLTALRQRASTKDSLATFTSRQLNHHGAIELGREAEQAWLDVVRFDSSNLANEGSLISARRFIAVELAEVGLIDEALAKFKEALAPRNEKPIGEFEAVRIHRARAFLEADRGNREAALGAKAAEAAASEALRIGGFVGVSKWLFQARSDLVSAALGRAIALRAGDYEAVIAQAEPTARRIDELAANPERSQFDEGLLWVCRSSVLRDHAEASIMLGRFAAAEALFNNARELGSRTRSGSSMDYLVEPIGREADFVPWPGLIWHALAVARQGRGNQALKVIEPARRYYQERKQRGSDSRHDATMRALIAVVDALAQPADSAGAARRDGFLDAAGKELDALTEEARQTYYPRVIRKWIAEEEVRAAATRERSTLNIQTLLTPHGRS